MATIIKRELSVKLKFTDGDTLTLTGDTAQNVLQEYIQHYKGSINNALKFINENGNEEYKEFDCLCGLEILGMTENEVEVDDCTSLDCIDCGGCTGTTDDTTGG